MADQGAHRTISALLGARRGAAWLFAALLPALAPGLAAADCRVALAFALDVSASVDAEEYRLQRDGLAAALLADEVQALLFSGPPVAIAVYEWSGRHHQAQTLGWTVLTDPGVLRDALAHLALQDRLSDEFPTGIGAALGFGTRLMEQAPPCDRRVIDISGDGVHNDGFSPQTAYRYFPIDGITVNGLVILGEKENVVDHYRREVIHGPGAFVEIAGGYQDFEEAMRRKLLRELNLVVSAPRLPIGHGRPTEPG